MDTAAGGSGDDGRGNRRSSAGKGKTQVKSESKPKMSAAWRRAMIRYLQAPEAAVAAGLEPPADGRYATPPVAGEATAPADPKNTPKDA